MPDDKKIEIRQGLAQNYFGKENSPHNIRSPIDIKQIKDIVVELMNAAKKQ